MVKQKHEKLIEWVISEDIETTQYQISDLLKKSGFEIIDTAVSHFDGNIAICIILLEGHLFIREFAESSKVFIELTSFNHEKYLDFVIRIKHMILENKVSTGK